MGASGTYPGGKKCIALWQKLVWMTTLFYAGREMRKIAIFLAFWQVDSKNRAFSELRIDGHLAAVQERQVFHYREA